MMNATTSQAPRAAFRDSVSSYDQVLAAARASFVRGLQAPPERREQADEPWTSLADFVRSLVPPQILVTRAEYARSRAARGLPGGTKSAICRAVKSGRISAFGRDKLLDPRMADFEMARWARPSTLARAAPTLGDGGGEESPVEDASDTAGCVRRLPARESAVAAAAACHLAAESNPLADDDEPLYSPLKSVERLASGDWDVEDITWLQKGLATWINAEGQLPLDLCLRLPRSASRLRKARRGVWLAKAAFAMDGATLWRRCNALSKQLEVFISRGEWGRWYDRKDPPPGAPALLAALFYVAKGSVIGGGTPPKVKALSARHIFNLLSEKE